MENVEGRFNKITKKFRKHITPKAPNINDDMEIDKTVLRRVKIREYRRAGYSDPRELSLALRHGVKTRDGQIIHVAHDIKTIKDDLDYLIQEDLSADEPFAARRAVLLDQLRDLYRQAYREYREARGPMKNSFLNTAFSIIKAIIEMEGVLTPNAYIMQNEETQLISTAKKLENLNEDEQKQLIAAFKAIAEGDKDEGATEKTNILDGES